jgi:hypothetical protein
MGSCAASGQLVAVQVLRSAQEKIPKRNAWMKQSTT